MNWSTVPLDPLPQDDAPRATRSARRITMRHLPIFLELGGKAAVVVGGGVVAARRAEHLIRAGARVTTFAPALSDDFRELLDAPNFRHEARDPEPKDFEGVALCFVAVEDERLSAEAWAAAKRRRRMGQRRRPAAVLRLHHALDHRPRPARHRDFDRRRFADSGPHAEGAPGNRHSRRLRPSCRPHGRIPRRGRQGDRLSGHAPPILGDGARGTDRRTGALRRRARRGRRTHSRHRTRGAPRTPRRRAARSISSARGPAIPIF